MWSDKNGPNKSRTRSCCVGLLLATGIFLFFSWGFIWDAFIRPILFSGPAHAAESKCLSHLKIIATGIAMYTQDWDERFPPASSWSNNLTGLKSSSIDEDVLQCPSAHSPFGYAFNQKIAGKRFIDFADPREQVIVFESDSHTPNESGGIEKLPANARHAGCDTYAFLDGHATWRMRSIPVKW
jgi:hypothetical protein